MAGNDDIGVGIVGIGGEEVARVCQEVLTDPRFVPQAFCDEGCEDPGGENKPLPYYPDYNMMLQDSRIELIVIAGDVERRKDCAVRALNGGRHVVTGKPFCAEASEADRIAKTARRNERVATCDMAMRDEPAFRALLAALERESAGPPYGLHSVWSCPEEQREAIGPGGLLQTVGMDLLDQLRLLIEGEIKSVTTHLHCPRPDGPEDHFLVHLALRNGGWAVLQGSLERRGKMPRWAAFVPHASFVADESTVTVESGNEARTYGPPAGRTGFWDNLYDVIREGRQVKCQPVEIARAFKLWEAALDSAESRETVRL